VASIGVLVRMRIIAGVLAVPARGSAASARGIPAVPIAIAIPTTTFRVVFVTASPSSPTEAGNAGENWHWVGEAERYEERTA
jgi:hypothetical protein